MLAFLDIGKFLYSNWRVVGCILGAIIVIWAYTRINNAFEEAARVPALIEYAEKLEKQAIQFQESLERQRVEEQKRIDENKIIIAKQAKSIQTLRAENAKSANITIPANLLQAIRDADATQDQP